jgi:hypothetical protein
LPSGFLSDLDNEDDWSFIIKSHALIEAALSNLLSTIIDSRLEPIFEQLELSNSRTGKIAFAEALGVLNSKQRMFVRKLSELRNIIVHNIKNINFDLNAYVSSLDKNQRDAFAKAFTYFAPTLEAATSWRFYAIKQPKQAIFIAVILLLNESGWGVRRGRLVQADTLLAFEKAKLWDETNSKLKPAK